jgi:hypothetical protein
MKRVADHFWYICFLGLLASVTDGSWPCITSLIHPCMFRNCCRGCTEKDLNEETLAADNGRQQSSETEVTYESNVSEGVQ